MRVSDVRPVELAGVVVDDLRPAKVAPVARPPSYLEGRPVAVTPSDVSRRSALCAERADGGSKPDSAPRASRKSS